MRQWTVDAFASKPFFGNQACVLEPFDIWPSNNWMQTLAAENNQAETAYLRRRAEPGQYDLRWFTPAVEAPLCGHATLATAHVLKTELGETAEDLSFHTHSGLLTVRATPDGAYEMNFPAERPTPIPVSPDLQAALGVKVVEAFNAAYLVAILEDEDAVRRLNPDMAKVAHLPTKSRAGQVVVAALAHGKPYAVVSRFFAPGAGIAEDPATGSAHCILAPLFAEKLGRTGFECFQAYPGRGAEIGVDLQGERVLLRGSAVTVIASELRLPV